MDNVTHSLAGLVLAESAVRLRPRYAGLRAVAAISSMIAANLPDADLLYTGTGRDHLAYMLHHRGYTHTVVMALVGGALVWGVVMLVLRWRGAGAGPAGVPTRGAHSKFGMSAAPNDTPTAATTPALWLLGLLLVSTLSHLVLDWTNSYGVHLFWPFNDHWSYGDSVFIVEPWFWVVAVPMLVASTKSTIARVLLSLVLLLGLTLAWRTDFVSRGAAIALTVGAAISIALRAHLVTAVAGWIAVTLVMATGASIARRAVMRDGIIDIVVTPMPANAVCMSVITVERTGTTYRVATGRVSAIPRLVDASACGSGSGSSSGSVHWDTEWTAPVAELTSLARESCPALAALRFIRVPVWRSNDNTVMLGDARFRGFTDVTVPRRSTACPKAVPPWIPPRADVLSTS